ncbi:hypothetical protein WJX84_010319 [Apatococcus fuscideae]|uniref:J domain-containing protein n=1 Tax=Apatococcus fuscideae TaxID=2026836 RepID=A0AAW1SP99_9CHLO
MDSDTDEDRPGKSLYAVLNVSPTASFEEIRRSYRSLAQTYHPDKQPSADLRAEAAAQFATIQNAYEVLLDAERRRVYDVYGEEGLQAGLQVSTFVQDRDDLRLEWQRFRIDQKSKELAARLGIKSSTTVRVDATQLVSPYDAGLPVTPEITAIQSSGEAQFAISERDVVYSRGEFAMRKGGSDSIGGFLAGYRRELTPDDSLQGQVMLGLKSLVTIVSTRKLSPHDSASLAATWQFGAGPILQVTAHRQLTKDMEADLTWALGPHPMHSLSLDVSRRSKQSRLSGIVEVGAAPAVGIRASTRLGRRLEVRAAAKLGLLGWELEAGALQRLLQRGAVGLTASCGAQGITLKVRLAWANASFEFPMLLSHETDFQSPALLYAYVLPPAVYYITRFYIWRPLARRRRTQQCGHGQEPARRRVLAEAAQGGLVIVDAQYGVLEVVLEDTRAADGAGKPLRTESLDGPPGDQGDAAEDTGQDSTAAPSSAADSEASPGTPREHSRTASTPEPVDAATARARAGRQSQKLREERQRQRQQRRVESQAAGEDLPDESESGSEAGSAAAAEADGLMEALSKQDLPPEWIDVTTPLRFLVASSHLKLHEGVAKSGLMGFCDTAPGQPKSLRIRYLYHGKPHVTTVEDVAGIHLPIEDAPECTSADASSIHRSARAQGIDPAAHAQPGAWQQNDLFD